MTRKLNVQGKLTDLASKRINRSIIHLATYIDIASKIIIYTEHFVNSHVKDGLVGFRRKTLYGRKNYGREKEHNTTTYNGTLSTIKSMGREKIKPII